MFPWLWLRRWALPYLPCLTESWKQRQEGELGFIFIPQPGILTEREEGCCLVSFTFYAQRRCNFWSSHFCFFLTPQFFFPLSLTREIQNWFLKQDFQLKLLMPGSKASLCLLNCKVLAKKAKYWVYATGLVTLVISVYRESQLLTSFYLSLREECPISFPLAGMCYKRHAVSKGSLQAGATVEASGCVSSPSFAEPGSSQGWCLLGKRWHLCPLHSPSLGAIFQQAEFSRWRRGFWPPEPQIKQQDLLFAKLFVIELSLCTMITGKQ